MSLEINGKRIKEETEILEIFSIKISTIRQWYKNGLAKFKINRKNYIFEEDLEKYFQSIKGV